MKLTHDEVKQLTHEAYSIAMRLLESTGNRPHVKHKQAIEAILDAMTSMAEGSLTGRWAFGLQTGLGKTTSAVSWVAALSKLNLLDRVSVAIAALDVESLCETLDMLVSLGVSKDDIGLLHRKSGATYDATPNATDKPILLLCHARVADRYVEQFKYRGEMRDLLIYDESLMTTSSSVCPAAMLYALSGAMQNSCKRDEEYRRKHEEVSVWLREVEEAVAKELDRLKVISSTQSVMLLPQRPQETLDRFEAIMKGNETVQALVKMTPSPVKISNFADKGVLSFQITVPSVLRNIIVLDASNAIRDLVKHDRSVFDAEQHLPAMKALGVPLASLKRYDGTTIYQMRAGGGKGSMVRSFKAKYNHQRRICKEVIEVLGKIPEDESTLIVAFKPAYDVSGPVNFVKILEEDINASGVVTMKNQDSVEMTPSGKPRVSITTWGLHKGTNKHKHCKNLIMVGIVHRDMLDLFGVMSGLEGLAKEQTQQRLRDIQMSEVAHDAFQAIGRIACRTVVDGKAVPVNVWLIEYSTALQERLAPVMEGAVWKKWETKYDEIPEGKEPGIIKQAAMAINNYLSSSQKTKVSVKDLRTLVPECSRLEPKSFTRAVDSMLTVNQRWGRNGHSLVLFKAVFGSEPK